MRVRPRAAFKFFSSVYRAMAGLGHGSNACSVLNSYHSDCHYQLRGEIGPPHNKLFTMAVSVMGDEFIGTGRSKKLAKQAAAAEALRRLYNLQLSLSEQRRALGEFCVLIVAHLTTGT